MFESQPTNSIQKNLIWIFFPELCQRISGHSLTPEQYKKIICDSNFNEIMAIRGLSKFKVRGDNDLQESNLSHF